MNLLCLPNVLYYASDNSAQMQNEGENDMITTNTAPMIGMKAIKDARREICQTHRAKHVKTFAKRADRRHNRLAMHALTVDPALWDAFVAPCVRGSNRNIS